MELANQFLASIPVPVIEQQRSVDTIGRRKSRGKSAELELVHLLEKYGYGARRSAASGVGGWISDVEATKQGIWLAIEVKSSRRAYAIIPKHQLEKIRQDLSFAGKSGIPTLGICAAKFPHCEPPWCFYKLSPEDYSKPFIKIRRGQASNWIPLPKEQLTSEDPFSLEPSKSYFPARMGRPVSNIPTVKCPKCGETAHRPTAYKRKSRGKIYTYWRYWPVNQIGDLKRRQKEYDQRVSKNTRTLEDSLKGYQIPHSPGMEIGTIIYSCWLAHFSDSHDINSQFGQANSLDEGVNTIYALVLQQVFEAIQEAAKETHATIAQPLPQQASNNEAKPLLDTKLGNVS